MHGFHMSIKQKNYLGSTIFLMVRLYSVLDADACALYGMKVAETMKPMVALTFCLARPLLTMVPIEPSISQTVVLHSTNWALCSPLTLKYYISQLYSWLTKVIGPQKNEIIREIQAAVEVGLGAAPRPFYPNM